MSRVACIGECMVELSLPPDGVGEARLGFAGDTANVAIYLAREAGPAVEVAYVTALGDDKLSDRMAEFLAGHNLDVSLIERREGKAPGLYAISLDGKGERSFIYWRESSAARTLFRPAEVVTFERLRDFELIYLSGISLAVLSPQLGPSCGRSLRNIAPAAGRSRSIRTTGHGSGPTCRRHARRSARSGG